MSKQVNITENDIIKLVTESVKKIIKEDIYGDENYSEIAETKQLRNVIRRMVKEAFDMSYGVPTGIEQSRPAGGVNTNTNEKLDSAHDIRKKIRQWAKTHEKEHGKEKSGGRMNKSKRSLVITWLKKNDINCAEIMRKLWHPAKEDEDSARSYFYKCRDGKLNDSGVPYRFTDEEINTLYRIKSEASA